MADTHRGEMIVPRPPPTTGGVQATSSFHSVSSIDSSAEMARYFPDAQTPDFSAYRHQQQDTDDQRTQSTSATLATSQSYVNATGPYRPVPVATTTTNAPVQTPAQQPVRPPPGHPSYATEVEGLSISQALVNDVIVDLQSKVINESQNQYYSEASTGTYLEPLPPIHIRAPNPTIILRSDLNRLRAEFQQNIRARALAQQRARGMNRFPGPRFPNPRQNFY